MEVRGRKIEEVREIKYLRFLLERNGRVEAHIRDRVRKATLVIVKTWSTGEKLFKGDFRRKIKMFEALVASVALYGSEI